MKTSLPRSGSSSPASLEAKATQFADVVKSGRTHLMDATPVTLGQEFGGYAAQVRKGSTRVEKVLPELEELALGGTAVGTGINAPAGYAAAVIAVMAERTGFPYREAAGPFRGPRRQGRRRHGVGGLKTVATSFFKIANDIRFLGSGPTSGIAELRIPSLQPGSSIMPGKVNPVMSEMMMMVAAQVVGNDATITWSGANGNFELNVMMPVIAHDLLESIELLAHAADTSLPSAVSSVWKQTSRSGQGTAGEERDRRHRAQSRISATTTGPGSPRSRWPPGDRSASWCSRRV